MLPPSSNFQRIAFDRFEADLRSGELRKEGRRIRLQAKPFQLLALLLEHAGEVVAREEICRKLWNADTFVDFDHSLGTAINKIREALSDSAEQPRFIETLPRRGYRFIGEISIPLQATSSLELAPSKSTRWMQVVVAGAFVVSLGALAGMFAYRWSQQRRQPEQRAFTPFPFTALQGDETSPAFSPDGSRIVFAWTGDPGSGAIGYDLYVKAIGSETLLRLTHHPSEWLAPAWSPDATQIVFHRMAGADTGLYVVPALGGPERKLRSTRVPYAVATHISWSPDGKWIAFSDPLPTETADRIYFLNPDTLETRPLPHNPKCRHEAMPVFSHSGAQLAYLCVRSTNEFELYSIALPDAPPRFITAFSNFPNGVAWSADDRSLILGQFTAEGPELYEVNLAKGSSLRLPMPANAVWPAVSPKGGKLAFTTSSDNINIWRKDLLHPKLPSVKLLSSTREQNNPQYSPDGAHVAFDSTRSGPWRLWVSNADGSNLVQIASLDADVGNPRWSPDSKHVVFDAKLGDHFESFIVDISERIPRKLITNTPDVSTPSWSHDGNWIYFRSHEALGHKLYRCPANGGEKLLVSADLDGTTPLESPDGLEVYFSAREVNALLKKVSLSRPDGVPLSVGLPPVSNLTLWTITGRGIYFVPAEAPRSLRYFDFSTKQIRELFQLDKDFGGGLSVSPDGRYLLYSQVDEENTDIMLVEHFL